MHNCRNFCPGGSTVRSAWAGDFPFAPICIGTRSGTHMVRFSQWTQAWALNNSSSSGAPREKYGRNYCILCDPQEGTTGGSATKSLRWLRAEKSGQGLNKRFIGDEGKLAKTINEPLEAVGLQYQMQSTYCTFDRQLFVTRKWLFFRESQQNGVGRWWNLSCHTVLLITSEPRRNWGSTSGWWFSWSGTMRQIGWKVKYYIRQGSICPRVLNWKRASHVNWQ